MGALVTEHVPTALTEHVVGDAGSAAPSVASLRGAKVDVDPRKAARAVLAIVLATLVGIIAFLSIAGVRKNDQITELRDHGEPVAVTVASCLGELGGSGSNVAAYSCTGTYAVRGSAYTVALPGTAQLAPGRRLRGVVSEEDPSLFTLASVLAGEHASWRVFLTPLVLAVLLVVVLLALRQLRARARTRREGGRPDYDVGGV